MEDKKLELDEEELEEEEWRLPGDIRDGRVILIAWDGDYDSIFKEIYGPMSEDLEYAYCSDVYPGDFDLPDFSLRAIFVHCGAQLAETEDGTVCWAKVEEEGNIWECAERILKEIRTALHPEDFDLGDEHDGSVLVAQGDDIIEEMVPWLEAYADQFREVLGDADTQRVALKPYEVDDPYFSQTRFVRRIGVEVKYTGSYLSCWAELEQVDRIKRRAEGEITRLKELLAKANDPAKE